LAGVAFGKAWRLAGAERSVTANISTRFGHGVTLGKANSDNN
jgi:hypothetical protein